MCDVFVLQKRKEKRVALFECYSLFLLSIIFYNMPERGGGGGGGGEQGGGGMLIIAKQMKLTIQKLLVPISSLDRDDD